MRNAIVSAATIFCLSTSAASASDCVEKDRVLYGKTASVNIKVKNDTPSEIIVSIQRTSDGSYLAKDATVPVDGKEGKTDNQVKDATYEFTAKYKASGATGASCSFRIEREESNNGNRTWFRPQDCVNPGVFNITCDKSFNKAKSRWNVTYSLME